MVFLSIFCIRIFISVAKLELQAFCCCTLCRVEWFITFLIFQKKDHIAADQVYFWESYSKKLENFVVHAWHAWGKHYKHFILSPKICKTVFELEKEKKIEFLWGCVTLTSAPTGVRTSTLKNLCSRSKGLDHWTPNGALY